MVSSHWVESYSACQYIWNS